MPPALMVPGARTFSRSFGLGMLAVIQRSSLQRFHHCESRHPIWTVDLGEFNKKEEEDWTQAPCIAVEAWRGSCCLTLA